jgi:hypothetical protein
MCKLCRIEEIDIVLVSSFRMCSKYLNSIHVHQLLSAYMLLENVKYSLLVGCWSSVSTGGGA